MAGFLKKLFGGGNTASAGDTGSQAATEIYKDIEIRAAPMPEAGGQFRIAGTLTLSVEGGQEVRRFIRADLVAGKEEAVKMTVEKARMIIDQQGEHLWKGDPEQPV